MGTNFYMFTNDKEIKKKYFPESTTQLVDEPEFGYEIHIAKTSCGWLPLFQAHQNIKSVKDYICLLHYCGVKIYDEYGKEYDWIEFEERVVNWNKDNPEAISHFTYENGKYASHYFKDDEGFEFSNEWFS
jgi:hypothetical protein